MAWVGGGAVVGVVGGGDRRAGAAGAVGAPTGWLYAHMCLSGRAALPGSAAWGVRVMSCHGVSVMRLSIPIVALVQVRVPGGMMRIAH